MTHPAAIRYFGIPGHYGVWLLMTFSLIIFGFVLYRRIRLIRLGKADPRFSNIGKRFLGLLTDGLLQKRQPRYPMTGILHIVIFWGFLVLGLHSIELVVSGLLPGQHIHFLHGPAGKIYALLKDIFVLLVLCASLLAIYHRRIVKPKRYADSHQFEAYLVLGLIAFLMITDLLHEGSRISMDHSNPVWLPAAAAASAILKGVGPDRLVSIYTGSYWLHLAAFFLFLNLLPQSKHFHIITALPNVFFKKLNQGAIKPPQWNTPDMEHLDEAGVLKFEDFTWKHILDFMTCTECGRCTDNCPANAIGKPLSPKQISMTLRDFGRRNAFGSKMSDAKTDIPGNVIDDEVFWSCTTCGACEAQCPVFIEYIDKIVELRRRRVLMESRFPAGIDPVFRNMEIFGDAWGMGQALRTEWARGLNINTLKTNPDVDVLFWVGCAGAYEDRSQKIAVSFARLLNRADVKFGILGEEEGCCGDYARRTGNEYLFQTLAKKNIRILNGYGVRKIVAICPHGFNTLKNEYPQLGGRFEVVHAVEFLHALIEKGKLKLKNDQGKSVVYHDPCYLGRHNGIYDAPRDILSKIPGMTVREAEKTRDRSFCCGAGGGHFWMESTGSRINDLRVRQLLETSCDMMVTGCPYCLVMMEDGLESSGKKGIVRAMDIIELVEQAVSDDPSAG